MNISLSGYNNEKTIKIFDRTGKMVMTEKTMQHSTSLQTGTLPAGLYLVKITASDGTVLSQNKFVKD